VQTLGGLSSSQELRGRYELNTGRPAFPQLSQESETEHSWKNSQAFPKVTAARMKILCSLQFDALPL
jgi:hypothetical protein